MYPRQMLSELAFRSQQDLRHKQNTQNNKRRCLTGPDRHLFLLMFFLVFGVEQAAHQNASPVPVRLRWKQHLRLKCLEKHSSPSFFIFLKEPSV